MSGCSSEATRTTWTGVPRSCLQSPQRPQCPSPRRTLRGRLLSSSQTRRLWKALRRLKVRCIQPTRARGCPGGRGVVLVPVGPGPWSHAAPWGPTWPAGPDAHTPSLHCLAETEQFPPAAVKSAFLSFIKAVVCCDVSSVTQPFSSFFESL